MNEEAIREYVKEKLEQGYTPEEIKKELLKQKKSQNPKKNKLPLKIISLTIIFLLIVIISLYYLNLNENQFNYLKRETSSEKNFQSESFVDINEFSSSQEKNDENYYGELNVLEHFNLTQQNQEQIIYSDFSNQFTDQIYSRPGCKDNSECNFYCENCKIEKTYCALGISECVQCLEDFDCKEGFVCYSYQCVKSFD
ncbi:MAG: hypothetical protein QXR30_00470 [Candidatus Woesearchaeota archaeon]